MLDSGKVADPPLEQEIKLDAETARLIRLYLERAALRLERRPLGKSTTYHYAFKAAAKALRALKPD